MRLKPGNQASYLAPSVRTLRVLGIDPGSETTGYGVVENEGSRYRLIEYAAIHTQARLPFSERILLISQRVEEVIERLKPDACSVEEPFFAANVKSALKLGRVMGAITVTAARSGLPVFEYSPLEIKSALVGYGRAEKEQVQEMVRVLLKLKQPPEPLDASDALAAAICHIHTAMTKQRMGEPLDPALRRRSERRR